MGVVTLFMILVALVSHVAALFAIVKGRKQRKPAKSFSLIPKLGRSRAPSSKPSTPGTYTLGTHHRRTSSALSFNLGRKSSASVSMTPKLSNISNMSSPSPKPSLSGMAFFSKPGPKVPLEGVSLRWFIDFVETEDRVSEMLKKSSNSSKCPQKHDLRPCSPEEMYKSLMGERYSVAKSKSEEAVCERCATVLVPKIHGCEKCRYFLCDQCYSKSAAFGGFSTKDFCERMKHLTKDKKEAMVDLIKRQLGSKNVKSKADILVSHAWDYEFADVYEALKEYRDNLPKDKDIFIWLDVLVINQHKAANNEFPAEFWTKTFHKAINDIGRVAVVMTPWDNPYNLTRSWCLWEIYGTTLNEKTIVEVLIVPRQRKPFRHALEEDARDLMSRLGKIDVSKATAFSKSDQKMILRAAGTCRGGIGAVQESVIKPLRKWMLEEANRVLVDLKSKAKLKDKNAMIDLARMYRGIASLYEFQERKEEAINLFTESLRIRQEVFGKDHPEAAQCLNDLGKIVDKDEAEDHFKPALKIREKAYNSNPQGKKAQNDYVQSLSDWGRFLLDMNNLDTASTSFDKALEILLKAEGNDDLLSEVYKNLAFLRFKQGNYEQSEKFYLKAIERVKRINGDSHPKYATALHELANLLEAIGNVDEAEKQLKKSLEIKEKVFGREHTEYAKGVEDFANLLQKKKEFTEAASRFDESMKIYKSAYGPESEEEIEIHISLGKLFIDMQKFNDAEDKFKLVANILKENMSESRKTRINALSKCRKGMKQLSKGKGEKAIENLTEALREIKDLRDDDLREVNLIQGWVSQASNPGSTPIRRKSTGMAMVPGFFKRSNR